MTVDGFSYISTPGVDATIADNETESVLDLIWQIDGNELCTSTGAIVYALEGTNIDDGDTLDITAVYEMVASDADPIITITDTA